MIKLIAFSLAALLLSSACIVHTHRQPATRTVVVRDHHDNGKHLGQRKHDRD